MQCEAGLNPKSLAIRDVAGYGSSLEQDLRDLNVCHAIMDPEQKRSPRCHYRKLRPSTRTSIDQVMQYQRLHVSRFRSDHTGVTRIENDARPNTSFHCQERLAPWMEGLLFGWKTQPGGIEATARNVLSTARNVRNMASRKTGYAARRSYRWCRPPT